MSFRSLASLEDPELLPYRDLPQANLTDLSGLFVVEGWLLVQRLLASGLTVESVLLESSRLETFGQQIPANIPVLVAPPGMIDQIVGFRFHRGVLACGHRPSPQPRSVLIPQGEERWTLVVGVEIQDPTNLGGILRNAAAFGAQGVLLGPHCADPYSRRVLRVSMGTVFRLNVVKSEHLAEDLRWLHETHNVQFAATVLEEGAEPLEAARRPLRFGLLFGNEGHGLPRSYVELCERRITLPMAEGIDSLNAAVATGVFLYHFTRQANFF